MAEGTTGRNWRETELLFAYCVCTTHQGVLQRQASMRFCRPIIRMFQQPCEKRMEQKRLPFHCFRYGKQ